MIGQTTLPGKAAFFAADAPTNELSRRVSLQLLVTALVGDIVVIFIALVSSSWLRFETPLADVGTTSHLGWVDYGRHIVFGTLLFALILVHFQMYSLPRLLRIRQALSIVVKASIVWLVAYIAFYSLLRVQQPVSRLYVFIACATTMFGLVCWREVLHHFVYRSLVQGRLRQRILFVGWNEHAAALAEAMTANRQHLYEVAGCVPSAHGRYVDQPPARLRKLGDYSGLKAILQRHDIDMVILTDMNPSNGEMVGLANLCEKEMVDFKVIPSCFQILVSGLHLDAVSGVPVLGISKLPLDDPFNVVTKQIVDLIGGAVGLVLSFPIIALFGLLVYLESPGPIFYRQRRLGQNGRLFWIYKIRSMKLDAEKDGRVGWSTREDPRRLRIGSFMRKFNIDELPQFWNVLKGDMSLVGPRPERPELIENFKEDIPHYNARHNIKPGITGWAQVNGFRGDTDLRERVRYDLYYIENWSPLLDFQIMAMTVLTHKNAC